MTEVTKQLLSFLRPGPGGSGQSVCASPRPLQVNRSLCTYFVPLSISAEPGKVRSFHDFGCLRIHRSCQNPLQFSFPPVVDEEALMQAAEQLSRTVRNLSEDRRFSTRSL
jgi:hypothetical protein